jgi:hypothetical protein
MRQGLFLPSLFPHEPAHTRVLARATRSESNITSEGTTVLATRFHVGSKVRVCRASLSGPVTTSEFTIVERYAVEGREAMYRLSSVPGEAERVVPESELRRTRLHLSQPKAGVPA